LPVDPFTAETVRQETDSAQKVIAQILPPREFFNLAEAIKDSTEWDRQAPLWKSICRVLKTIAFL